MHAALHGLLSLLCWLRYVSGRTRTPGEINGKSANVNNCLRNVIFPEYEGRPQDIPLRELVVVFDADMAARKNFLLKVGRNSSMSFYVFALCWRVCFFWHEQSFAHTLL